MELKDLFITPIYLLILYFVAFIARPWFTDKYTRRYFIAGLTAKFIGAIFIGLIYQFYYNGGDTFVYFNHGSRWIWEAFLESPVLAFKLIFADNDFDSEIFKYTSRMYNYGDEASYFVVRVAGFFDLLTFHSYVSTSILFAFLSFSGVWMIYATFYKFYPHLYKWMAWGILFFPSLVFWGSGILKDSLTIGALGWLFYGVVHLFVFRTQKGRSIIFILIGTYVLFVVKIYILLCFLPAALFWIFILYQSQIRNVFVKILLAPALILLGIASGSSALFFIGQDHYRYSMDRIAITAEETARWNYYVSQREGGSGYSLGDYDFSPSGLLLKFPQAVMTTFYRPLLFEARNPLMLIAAIENSVILLLSLSVIFRADRWKMLIKDPVVIFCFLFAILFSFAVGVTTYNLGSLVRYKIPMLPFLIAGLLIVNGSSKNAENRHHT